MSDVSAHKFTYITQHYSIHRYGIHYHGVRAVGPGASELESLPVSFSGIRHNLIACKKELDTHKLPAA